jgi:hypothetical protein
VLEVAAARGSIMKQSTKLVRDKEAQTVAGKDILSLMIAENRKAEGKLAEMEMTGQVMTFILAGHETTSTAVILHGIMVNQSCPGDCIFLRNIPRSKLDYVLRFNISRIQLLNKSNHVVT